MMELYHADCLDKMKDIADGSIDMILTDPPYNIKKAKWDNIPNYIEWCGMWFIECQRVLKDNASFYFFHNDMVQISQLMEWIRQNTRFIFNSFIVWDKGDFRALSWKNPSEANNLRSWFSTCEYCLYYTFQDETGLSKVMLDMNNFQTLRKYFYDLLCYMGETNKSISNKLGHRKAEHSFYVLPKKVVIDAIGTKAVICFRYGSTQWDLPTAETYQELIDVFGIDKWSGFRPYESLRQEYESLRQEYESLRQEYESLRYTHNLDKNHSNVWHSSEVNNDRYHMCKKPTDILQRIIKTSSNEGDIVLDMFMGSGSTGVACINTRRNFIGIEKDETYFNIAQKRIADREAELKQSLFAPTEA